MPGIFLAESLLLPGLFAVNGFLRWSGARSRPGQLLLAVLAHRQSYQRIFYLLFGVIK